MESCAYGLPSSMIKQQLGLHIQDYVYIHNFNLCLSCKLYWISSTDIFCNYLLFCTLTKISFVFNYDKEQNIPLSKMKFHVVSGNEYASRKDSSKDNWSCHQKMIGCVTAYFVDNLADRMVEVVAST